MTFQFSELNDRAKERARSGWRAGGLDYEWWESTYEDAERAAACLGIAIDRFPINKRPKIHFSGFWSQGDGASWEGQYAPKLDAVQAIAEYAPQDKELGRIARELTVFQTTFRLMYGHHVGATVTTRGHHSHSGTMNADVYFSSKTEINDVAPPEELIDAFAQLLRDFADWIYAQLEKEYDYLMSDEVIDEQLADYTFDEAGFIV